MVTWPSAISTALLSLRTHKTVVPCISALPWLSRIPALYSGVPLEARGRSAACLKSDLLVSRAELQRILWSRRSGGRGGRSGNPRGRLAWRSFGERLEGVLQNLDLHLKLLRFARELFDLSLISRFLVLRNIGEALIQHVQAVFQLLNALLLGLNQSFGFLRRWREIDRQAGLLDLFLELGSFAGRLGAGRFLGFLLGKVGVRRRPERRHVLVSPDFLCFGGRGVCRLGSWRALLRFRSLLLRFSSLLLLPPSGISRR